MLTPVIGTYRGETISRRVADASSPTDTGYSALQHLAIWAERLKHAVRFRDACWELELKQSRKGGGEPEVFFFDPQRQSELLAARSFPSFLEAQADAVTRRLPRESAAWNELDEHGPSLIDWMTGSLEVRRVARVVPGFSEGVATLALDHPIAGSLTELLAVADEMPLRVEYPAKGRSWRVMISGIENNYQLGVLLADLLGEHQDPRIVSACRGMPTTTSPLVAHAAFGMYTAAALRNDGTLPQGLSGSDYWIWGERSPREIPQVDGERVILLGRPPYPIRWEVERRFPLMQAGAELIGIPEQSRISVAA